MLYDFSLKVQITWELKPLCYSQRCEVLEWIIDKSSDFFKFFFSDVARCKISGYVHKSYLE